MSRLDDLLSYEDKPRQRRRRRPSARLIRTLIFAVLASLLLDLILRAKGVGVPYVLMVTVFLAGGAMIELIRWLAPPPVPETLRDTQIPRPPDRLPDSDGAFRAVRRWASRLEWSDDDLRRFAYIVQPAVAGIVDERLRLRHAVNRNADPGRAEELCGRELWTFITVPATRPVSPNELATVVAQLEAL
jgi:hypothetical protein